MSHKIPYPISRPYVRYSAPAVRFRHVLWAVASAAAIGTTFYVIGRIFNV